MFILLRCINTRPSFLGAYKNITDEIRAKIAYDSVGLVAIHYERCGPKFALSICSESRTMVWRQCVACNSKVGLKYRLLLMNFAEQNSGP